MEGSKIKSGKLLLFVGLSLITGFIWGQVFALDIAHLDRPQQYSDPQIPIGQFDEMASVDIIRNGKNIWVTDHYTGRLIFEYNRFKEADKEAYREFDDLLVEALTRK